MSNKESFLNYYEILGCSKESTYENLKQAYRELVLRHHPDKVSVKETNSEEFQKIDEAWKVLRDPCSRRRYDIQFRQEELEAESKLVYAKVKTEELNSTGDKDFLSYPCRCGSSYLIDVQELNEKNSLLHVYCEECTFMIIVET